MSIVFETERLRAVPWREEHAEPAHTAYSQPDFVRYLGNSQPHPDLGHTRRWIARINELNAAGRPDGFWAVEVRGDGEHEIGWHVFPAHQSNGYGKRGRTSRYYDVEVELFTVTRDEFAEAGPAAPRR